MRHVDVCGLKFPIQNYQRAIATFEEWIAKGGSHQVCIANVHTVVTSLRDPELFALNEKADMITMDGQPLRWYANAVHKAEISERVCGPELMLRCLGHGQKKAWRHYFYGGHPEVLDNLIGKLHTAYPGADIVGAYSPPFRELTNKEDEAIIKEINDASPDFLWVGLGAPKQEKWIARNLKRIHAPVQLGVGAAFDFHAGKIKRAPDLIQRLSLEWLFRLWHDPRLWRRYLSTNPVFILMFVRDLFRYRVLKRQR